MIAVEPDWKPFRSLCRLQGRAIRRPSVTTQSIYRVINGFQHFILLNVTGRVP